MLREVPLSETDDNTNSPRSERHAYYLYMVRSTLLFLTISLTIVLSFTGWLCTKFDDSNGTLVGIGTLVGAGSIPVVINEPSCAEEKPGSPGSPFCPSIATPGIPYWNHKKILTGGPGGPAGPGTGTYVPPEPGNPSFPGKPISPGGPGGPGFLLDPDYQRLPFPHDHLFLPFSPLGAGRAFSPGIPGVPSKPRIPRSPKLKITRRNLKHTP
ncbi:hypothetical protein AGLY_010644, partial [Aphis glycines]